ncbi:hypothetical protein CMUS01_08933 [Colletotrichum musicola]|uniref:Uncharacterized protein n=1 Tax=Colletotrichum musicola TaxID=2175873 RepID=A0A8H6NCB0_9PEZI|nr:hypothetical protein CMUS01_08933 [Colletotrichum musicola]
MPRYSRYFLPTRQYFDGDKAPSALVLPLHPSSSLQVSKVAAQPNLEPRHPSEGEHVGWRMRSSGRQQQQPRSILGIRSSVTVLGEGSTSHKRPPPLDRTSTVPPLAHAEDA